MAVNSTELAADGDSGTRKKRRAKGDGGVRQVVFEPGKERWESSVDATSVRRPAP